MNGNKKLQMKTKCLTRVKYFALNPAKMKVEAVKYAEINGNRAAGQKYAVDEKRICEWGKNKSQFDEHEIGTIKEAARWCWS